MRNILLFFALMLGSFLLSAADGFPVLRTLTVFEQRNPTPIPGMSGQYDTISGSPETRWRNLRMGNTNPRQNAIYTSPTLVYVIPGGLEADNLYVFPFDEKLGLKYTPGTFSFSGRADSLFWISGIGWGTDDINLDITPLLLLSTYQEYSEPAYEFFWQNFSPTTAGYNGITLNYLFKIPKFNQITYGGPGLNVKQTFARGFSRNVPPVKNNYCLLCRNARFFAYGSDLQTKSPLRYWSNLSPDLQPDAFAVSGNLMFLALHEGIICAVNPDSTLKWSVNGRAPVIPCGKFLYSVTPDYSSIQATNMETGYSMPAVPLPRFLPRTPNSFATAEAGGRQLLFFLVPAQSKTFAFEIVQSGKK